MPSWPTSLPDYVLVDGYSESMGENTIISNMSVGPPKARRRATSAIEAITARIITTEATAASFYYFYDQVLESGALTFDWTHPRTGAAVTMRFMETPVFVPAGPIHYFIDMNIGILP